MSELENDSQNPIVEVDLEATSNDKFFFVNNPDEQYVGILSSSRRWDFNDWWWSSWC